ncbi:NADH-quinone oxidoreductase subunit NuoE [Candidatus Bodocaedibacter vickermanii]|uniref:NADH-quinone oxidoreductase subunit E n=1 Tax=Candidatus Bodocaedibacter vickermanii TaxID=2741701 RepID=A0A7L9RTA7_9PROT|nr:NADH-quinone oxidoreductase subunit E [Candidatus Paracaedibacteraceae bacterium 'Lake Konstanz']
MSSSFKFSTENHKKIKQILETYPKDHPQSAVMPLLDLAQAQNGGWLSRDAIETIAELLQMPVIRVQEVATFYTMYRLQPVGKTVIQVCTTTPCWLRGSDDVMNVCKTKLGIQPGETKNDISLFEVQCLGACVNAPIVQINDAYIEDVNPEAFSLMLDDVIAGKPVKTGSMIGRVSSEPVKGFAS